MSLFENGPDDRDELRELFENIQQQLAELESLREQCSGHWGYEDPVYRFYHQSFKVYSVQEATVRIVEKLKALAPGRPLNSWFTSIVEQGTGRSFATEHNKRWTDVTRPILEAFFHARFFLEMAVKYGKELKYPPRLMPSGWAALLHLYDLR
jgi:hypothetical protein